MAFQTVSSTTGKQLENALEGSFGNQSGDGKVFVILFYSDLASQANDQVRHNLKSTVLTTYPTLYYTEVNVNDSDYEDFAQRVIGVSSQEVTNSPSILIIESGAGAILHGVDMLEGLESKVPTYLQNAKNSY